MRADWREAGARIITLEASIITDSGLAKLATVADVDVDELVASRDFPQLLRITGTRGRYVRRDELLRWWRSRPPDAYPGSSE